MNVPTDRNEDLCFHECISRLKNNGYRGFLISKIRNEWDNGIQLTVKNENGHYLTVNGKTKEEACQKIIDDIDLLLDGVQ